MSTAILIMGSITTMDMVTDTTGRFLEIVSRSKQFLILGTIMEQESLMGDHTRAGLTMTREHVRTLIWSEY